MRTMNETITYELRQPDGTWIPVRMEQLDIGDIVRQLQPDGTVVPFPQGNTDGACEMVIVGAPVCQIDTPLNVFQQTAQRNQQLLAELQTNSLVLEKLNHMRPKQIDLGVADVTTGDAVVDVQATPVAKRGVKAAAKKIGKKASPKKGMARV